MPSITSRDNAKLKLARKARERRAEGLIFIEGLRLAEEVLRSEVKVFEIFIADDFAQTGRAALLLNDIRLKNFPLNEVPEKLFRSIADTQTSQGIILLCAEPKTTKTVFERSLAVKKSKIPVILFLQEINNPSNLGAILRTAEAVDAAGIIISKKSADVFSAKSLRASMGAGLRLNIWTNAGFEDVLEWARENNLITTGADIRAEKSYTEIDWNKPRLLIFGSEAHGLCDEDFRKIDESLLIPMENGVESLNLAVSCGIVLFEARRYFK